MRRIFVCLLLALAPVSAAANETIRDRVIQELRQDGYTEVRVYRTFLGRLRFVGENQSSRREIVISPSTGVVLRDYLRVLNESEDDDRAEDDNDDLDSGDGSEESGSSSGSSGSGSNNDDDDDSDGDDDDDDDDD